MVLTHIRSFLAMSFVLLGVLPSLAADHVIDAAFKTAHVDLLPKLQLVESAKPQVKIELRGNDPEAKVLMSLKANGVGQPHRWVVFTVSNPDRVSRDLVLVISHQNFSSSRVIWPRRNGSVILGVQASSGPPTRNLFVLGADAVAIKVEPDATVSYAAELASATLEHAMLWQRDAYDAKNSRYSFFRGVVLGIAMFLAIGFFCLFIVRTSAVFPASGLFAIAAIGFIAFDAGYFARSPSWLPDNWQAVHSRAVIESSMLLGVVLTLTTFLDLRQRSPIWCNTLILVALASVAMAVYAWYEPVLVAGISRLAFAGIVLLGFGLTVHYWQQASVRAQASLLPWTVLLIWTMAAAFACLDIISGEIVAPALAAGLVLILVTMSFSLAQFAFDHGVSSYQFMRDSGRRALALAGSEQAVWDWHVHDGSLFVGSELERALGLTPGTIGGSDLGRWLDIIHPADRAVYVSSVEGAERRGRGSFAQDFRLRRADGSYRWFMLRARAMIGEDGSVIRLIGTLADVTADKRAEERLLSDAVRDRVTGLPNKALFLDRLQRAVARGSSSGKQELFVLVVDLDRFKSINDGLGHEAGDSILSVAGRRLTQLMGPEDSVGRLPGDQFGIIFDASRPTRDVIAFTEALRTALAQPIRLRNREVLITTSIGVAHCGGDRAHAEDLLKDAEIALFEAKRRGRGMIEFFRPAMRNETGELMALEQDLRRAVERDEIEVAYQPIMRVDDEQLAGFEALARWRHPKEGLLQPASFMGLAEETGIIRDIGRYVLNEAARQLGVWQRAFRPNDPLFVAVNVSSAQLIDFDLVAEIKGLLTREDILPGTLKLELTETMVMENPELSAKVLERIRQMGIGLACDDFGTGYSALANLARLPFDTLKIDRMFLEADAEDDRSAIILDTIILLAHDLDLDVVVEGVENGEQVKRLRELECDLAQGFFIGQPLTAGQVLHALGRLPYEPASKRGARPTFWDMLHGIGKTPDEEVTRGPTPATSRAASPPSAEAASVSGDPQPSAPQSSPVAAQPIEVWPFDDIVEQPAAASREDTGTAEAQVTAPAPPLPVDEVVERRQVERPIETAVPGEAALASAPPSDTVPVDQPASDLNACTPCEPTPQEATKTPAEAAEAKARPSASEPATRDEKPKSPAKQRSAVVRRAQPVKSVQRPVKKRSSAAKKRTGQLKHKLRKAAKTRKAKSK